ncbi:rab-GTPase-TBC domain-containing protein [Thamnidium elegans]|uniref:Rab-GAP TBC domain-containing protein n=1 Tax=Thamnidium elegans TaxID=101142 RepID=A0A8H7SID0_9FUNG|nr:hypothetical protein INT48_004077 [Thamnidium elegans]KAI8062997.1 rab-GTPase-TBC domain-containing protein [Thamnidium elegans]
MGTELNTSGSAVWLQLSNAQLEVEQAASQLTTTSSDTDFTTTQSSIRTTSSHVRKSTSDNSFEMNKRDSDLRQRYDQRPEKVPNIAAEMEKWYAMTDRYGFLDDNSNLDIKAKEKEVERAEKWAKMSESVIIHDEHAHSFVYSTKFKKRVYKGIPDCWRREAWYYLVTDCLRNATSDYKLRSTYRELLSKETSHERQIDLDIPRTLRDHIMFKQRYGSGQRALFNVLRAFANYDEEVGYCQGMTNIVATILMYCEEEKAFLILVHMFLRDKLHNLYIPGFPILMESFFIQERLLKRYMPKLYQHLADLGLSSDIYSTRWYITLFSGGVVRYHTLMRIWDAYFLCGYDVFFFVAVTLLKSYESRLLAGDLDTCMELLGSTMSVPDDNRFIRHVQKLFDKNEGNGTVDQLRQEYQAKHTTI